MQLQLLPVILIVSRASCQKYNHYLKVTKKADKVKLRCKFIDKIYNMIRWNLNSNKNLESKFSAPSPLLLIIHSQIAWWFMKTAIMLPRVLHSNSQFWLFKSNIGWMDARGTWSQCRGSLFHSGQPSLKIPIFCLTLDYMSLAYAND